MYDEKDKGLPSESKTPDDHAEQIGIDLLTEAGNISRGGLRSYEDMNKSTVQRVLGNFLSPTFKPKMTFSHTTVTFNTACVNLFAGHQHIVFDMDEENQRLIITPCPSYDRDSLKFANIDIKKNRNKPRTCTTRDFCGMIYEMMQWNRLAKYRCMAIYQEFGDHSLIILNLDECLQVFTEVVETGDGKKKRNTTVNMPEGWRGRFGYTLEELDAKNRLDATNRLLTVDPKTGKRHDSHVTAKLPTPEELMHRPYGGIRVNTEDYDEDV